MNIQTLKSKLLKGEIDGTKEVVAVIDNKEYSLIGLTKSPGKVLLVAELKEGIHVGESIEDEKFDMKVNPEFGEIPVEPLSFSSFDAETGIGKKTVVDIDYLPKGLSVDEASKMGKEELLKVIAADKTPNKLGDRTGLPVDIVEDVNTESAKSSTTVAEDIEMDKKVEAKKKKE